MQREPQKHVSTKAEKHKCAFMRGCVCGFTERKKHSFLSVNEEIKKEEGEEEYPEEYLKEKNMAVLKIEEFDQLNTVFFKNCERKMRIQDISSFCPKIPDSYDFAGTQTKKFRRRNYKANPAHTIRNTKRTLRNG